MELGTGTEYQLTLTDPRKLLWLIPAAALAAVLSASAYWLPFHLWIGFSILLSAIPYVLAYWIVRHICTHGYTVRLFHDRIELDKAEPQTIYFKDIARFKFVYGTRVKIKLWLKNKEKHTWMASRNFCETKSLYSFALALDRQLQEVAGK